MAYRFPLALVALVPAAWATPATGPVREIPAEVREVVDALTDSKQPIRAWQEAHARLRSMGRDLMPAVVDVFAQQLGQSHSTARRQLALAVGPQFRDVGAPLVPALMEMLKSDEQSESWAAAQALGFIGPEARQAVPQLIRAAQYGNELATVALGEIGDPRALRTLDLLAQEEGDRAAKTAARKIRAATAPTQPAARSASGPA